jgi:FtsZ-interacting cell division protein ZipA
MSTGATVAIIVVVVIVIVAIVLVAMTAARRRRLQRRFGPEYDRVVAEQKSQLKAENELASRERRVHGLKIRPLSSAARAGYVARWQAIQEDFVDQPEDAVTQAQSLVTAVMNDRGYPTEGHDQIVADLSVEHATTLEHYRTAYGISQNAAEGNASTEDLRQAMIHYRALFTELLTGPADDTMAEPAVAAGSASGGAPSMDPDPVEDPTSRAQRR